MSIGVAVKKLRPPVKRHGGKAYLARRIAVLFPPHRVYIEPFLGGGSVLLNKTPAEREVAGDLDAGLINLWEQLRSDPAHLFWALSGAEYSEASFDKAKRIPDLTGDPIDLAIGYLIRNRMSRGGLGKDFAWSDRLRGKRREGGPVPGDVNAWDTIRAELPAIAARVRRVGFECIDAVSLIRENDAPDALVYADPPYLHATRTVTKAYQHEMDRADHERLLACLVMCEAKAFLSGYRNDLYDSALSGWTRHEFDMPNHSGQGKTKQRRVECLWESPTREAV